MTLESLSSYFNSLGFRGFRGGKIFSIVFLLMKSYSKIVIFHRLRICHVIPGKCLSQRF